MRRIVGALCLSLLVSACGGGSGGTVPAPAGGGATAGGAGHALAVPQHYSIVDLGASVNPLAINNQNVVVGSSSAAGAFRYQQGTMQQLHAPGGGSAINATDINDSGYIVGTNGTAIEWRADGTAIDLGAPPLTFVQTVAIGNNGEILGISPISGIAGCGGALTVFAAGAPPKVVGPTVTSIGGINAAGVAAIGIYNQSGAACMGSLTPAFYPSFAAIPVAPQFTLDTFAGASAVTDINANGDVIGYSPTSTPQGTGPIATFLASGGKTVEIAPPSGYESVEGMGLNDLGWIVGTLELQATQVVPRAFVWSSGTLIDLNSLIPANCNWVLNTAQDVNNAGYIVGTGTFNGALHGFILVPKP